jgi:hypothetical protein
VALYNRALSAAEIRQHHNLGQVSLGYCVASSTALP